MTAPSRRVVEFPEPNRVDLVEEPLPELGPDQVRVKTEISAISPGTERLVYRGKAPSTLSVDTSIDALSGKLNYPVRYGYAVVGRVEAAGEEVYDSWLDQMVFAFQPHVSRFVASPEDLIALPPSVRARDGVMIPTLETAVNLLMDGRPMLGERVVVFGQGSVGLLTTGLAADFPVDRILVVEPIEERRTLAYEWGADQGYDPADGLDPLHDALNIQGKEAVEAKEGEYEGADLVYELSGDPAVLGDAVSVTGYDGRLVVGSWYGTKEARVGLGGRFHRSRIQIKSSQVSSVDPPHRGRWTKGRRMDVVLSLLGSIRPGTLVTDEYAHENAAEAYDRLARDASGHTQPVFRYK